MVRGLYQRKGLPSRPISGIALTRFLTIPWLVSTGLSFFIPSFPKASYLKNGSSSSLIFIPFFSRRYLAYLSGCRDFTAGFHNPHNPGDLACFFHGLGASASRAASSVLRSTGPFSARAVPLLPPGSVPPGCCREEGIHTGRKIRKTLPLPLFLPSAHNRIPAGVLPLSAICGQGNRRYRPMPLFFRYPYPEHRFLPFFPIHLLLFLFPRFSTLYKPLLRQASQGTLPHAP